MPSTAPAANTLRSLGRPFPGAGTRRPSFPRVWGASVMTARLVVPVWGEVLAEGVGFVMA
ncbi:hypothetical protein GCM10022226_35510 [Sphaerisporangium flaviroseum]|uniref:MFS transporter n=1 Tax=Sphaerisporangium flaviroseum TaxID=509199 RepID=A0ABP7I7Z4_9ACTN